MHSQNHDRSKTSDLTDEIWWVRIPFGWLVLSVLLLGTAVVERISGLAIPALVLALLPIITGPRAYRIFGALPAVLALAYALIAR